MGKSPKRTRQHVIEEESRQYVERILPDEWVVQDVVKDYGIDLTVEIVIGEEVTGASFSIQVKGTDNLVVRKSGHVSHSCKCSTLVYFLERPEPVIYLVYDTKKEVGYWIWIKDFIRQELKPGWMAQKTATVRIPLKNKFDAEAVKEIADRVLSFHEPAKWLSAIESAQSPYFSYGLEPADQGIRIDIRTKYPGAEQDRPVEVGGTFRFDMSDPEAQETVRALERHFKTGEPVEIDARYFDGFDIPEAFSDLFAGVEFRPARIELGTAKTDERTPAKIEILDQTGSVLLEIPYVELKVVQAGTDEVTRTNDDQDIPLRVRLRTNVNDQTCTFSIGMEPTGKDVVQIRDFLKIQQALTCAKWFKLTNLATGLSEQGEIPEGLIGGPEESLIELAHELAFIQETTDQVILWPDQITVAESQRVRKVANILRIGRSLEQVAGVHFTVDKLVACRLADRYASGEQFQLRFESQSYEVDLLGTKISLGLATAVLPNARPSNETLQRLHELDQLPDETMVRIDLDVGEPGIFLFYHQWLPQDSMPHPGPKFNDQIVIDHGPTPTD